MSAYLLFLQGENSGLGIRTKANIIASKGAISITLAGLSRVSRGDTLFIVGHGSTKTLAGHSPSQLASILTSNGISQPVEIYLYSCNTGFGGAPYALELKMQMVQSKILCTVLAPTAPINDNFNIAKPDRGSYKTGFIPTQTKPSWVR